MSGKNEFVISDMHAELVRAAVRRAFDHDRIDAIDPVSGGASGAFPFRVRVREHDYLVRIEGQASPLRNPHQYEALRIAADQGIAPRVYHIDETARVAVMDFIREQPLTAFPGGRVALAAAVGEMLPRVRATPPFPRFVDYPDIVGRLWAWVCRTGVFAPGVLDPVTERFRGIEASYSFDPADAVSSHNDLVPRNVLFDGQRLWLIDWESAYRNDSLVDTAIALDNFGGSFELDTALVQACWGRALTGEASDRLEGVRALTRLYYAGVLLSASFDGSGALADDDLRALTIDELREAIRDGRVIPGTPTAAHALGKMYVASFMTGVAAPPIDVRMLFWIA